jgi:hypothetical protein
MGRLGSSVLHWGHALVLSAAGFPAKVCRPVPGQAS